MARETYNSVEHDQLAGTQVEAEIREFVRRDVMTNREGVLQTIAAVLGKSPSLPSPASGGGYACGTGGGLL